MTSIRALLNVMPRRIAVFAAALVLAFGCGKSERSSVTDLVKQVASETRARARVKVRIHLAADEPTADERAMLRSTEDAVERDNIGRLVNSGWEPGYGFVTVEVEKTAEAIEKLRAILLRLGIAKRASFQVMAGE